MIPFQLVKLRNVCSFSRTFVLRKDTLRTALCLVLSMTFRITFGRSQVRLFKKLFGTPMSLRPKWHWVRTSLSNDLYFPSPLKVSSVHYRSVWCWSFPSSLSFCPGSLLTVGLRSLPWFHILLHRTNQSLVDVVFEKVLRHIHFLFEVSSFLVVRNCTTSVDVGVCEVSFYTNFLLS